MKKILLTMCIALCLPMMCMAKERLVLIGDASLAPHSIANPDVRGWGEKLSALFTDKVEVLNFAQAGESTLAAMPIAASITMITASLW